MCVRPAGARSARDRQVALLLLEARRTMAQRSVVRRGRAVAGGSAAEHEQRCRGAEASHARSDRSDRSSLLFAQFRKGVLYKDGTHPEGGHFQRTTRATRESSSKIQEGADPADETHKLRKLSTFSVRWNRHAKH